MGEERINSADIPIDAIVHDVHPALGAPYAGTGAGEYPYGPPAYYPPAHHEPPAGALKMTARSVDWLVHKCEQYLAAIQQPPDFVVPKTFGMSAIFGIMTALALLFACLRWLDAEPVFYFFFSAQALVICLAQMLHGQAPRVASILAGAIMLPLFTLLAAIFYDGAIAVVILAAVVLVPVGAGLGYLTGTCAAGIFLVMEYFEAYMQGHAVTGHGHTPRATP